MLYQDDQRLIYLELSRMLPIKYKTKSLILKGIYSF